MKSSIDTLTRLIIRIAWQTLNTVFSPYKDGKSNIILLRGLEYFDLLHGLGGTNRSFTCRVLVHVGIKICFSFKGSRIFSRVT